MDGSDIWDIIVVIIKCLCLFLLIKYCWKLLLFLFLPIISVICCKCFANNPENHGEDYSWFKNKRFHWYNAIWCLVVIISFAADYIANTNAAESLKQADIGAMIYFGISLLFCIILKTGSKEDINSAQEKRIQDKYASKMQSGELYIPSAALAAIIGKDPISYAEAYYKINTYITRNHITTDANQIRVPTPIMSSQTQVKTTTDTDIERENALLRAQLNALKNKNGGNN